LFCKRFVVVGCSRSRLSIDCLIILMGVGTGEGLCFDVGFLGDIARLFQEGLRHCTDQNTPFKRRKQEEDLIQMDWTSEGSKQRINCSRTEYIYLFIYLFIFGQKTYYTRQEKDII